MTFLLFNLSIIITQVIFYVYSLGNETICKKYINNEKVTTKFANFINENLPTIILQDISYYVYLKDLLKVLTIYNIANLSLIVAMIEILCGFLLWSKHKNKFGKMTIILFIVTTVIHSLFKTNYFGNFSVLFITLLHLYQSMLEVCINMILYSRFDRIKKNIKFLSKNEETNITRETVFAK